MSARSLARDALVRVEQGAFAHIVVPELLGRSGLDGRDRGFVTDLVYGTLRMRRAIDHQLAAVTNRPLADLDPEVRAALRLGAAQLLAGVAPHAAVSETVDVAPVRARGFVNGVLRALARVGPPWSWPRGGDVAAVGVRTSHPDWIVRLLVDEHGHDDAGATLAIDNEPAPVTLRPNPRRGTPGALAGALRAGGATVEPGILVPDALVVRGAGDAVRASVRAGRATPQDQASQAVVALLGPERGERLLDVAAAPGGKATAAAERMSDDGVVVAADLHPGRIRATARTVARLGLRAVRLAVGDGRRRWVRAGAFDRVLVDAPCSGLGVLRRRPDARWRVQSSDVSALAAVQRDMLATAAEAVRPGGRLVYAVCTLTREETRDVDAWAADALPQLRALAPPGHPWRPHGRGALLLPSDAGTDGMYVLVTERAG